MSRKKLLAAFIEDVWSCGRIEACDDFIGETYTICHDPGDPWDGQTLSREEAIRLYTAANGWFIKEEDRLGSIEPGKFGDLVVLNDDIFDPVKVPDEAIRRVRPTLTIVGGKVVYGTA